jgi:hypothetical protein
MRISTIAWVIAVFLVAGLYLLGPLIGFNRATPPIMGMPPLLFWFVLCAVLTPIIIGILYLIDRNEHRSDR